MEKIINYLQQLDLSEIESKIYVELLKSGPTNVRDLTDSVGIKRTTAYAYIDQLIEKGLISEVVVGFHKQIAANQPECLQYLIEKKLKTAVNLQKKLPELLKILEDKIPQNNENNQNQTKYYKGVNGIHAIYDEALSGKELRLYATLAEIMPLIPNDTDIFEIALHRNKKLKIFEIYGDSPDGIQQFSYTTKSKRYLHKFLPSKVELASSVYLIYDNNVAIIDVKNEIGGTVFHNKTYYINSVKLFDFIWSVLPDVNSQPNNIT